jgi:hypothetical protein
VTVAGAAQWPADPRGRQDSQIPVKKNVYKAATMG